MFGQEYHLFACHQPHARLGPDGWCVDVELVLLAVDAFLYGFLSFWPFPNFNEREGGRELEGNHKAYPSYYGARAVTMLPLLSHNGLVFNRYT